MAKEEKHFHVTIDGKEVAVSEDVYRAYKQPLWREHKRIERSQKCDLGKKRCDKKCDTCPYSKEGAPLSLDTMFEDGLDVSDGNNLEDVVELKETIKAENKILKDKPVLLLLKKEDFLYLQPFHQFQILQCLYLNYHNCKLFLLFDLLYEE